MQQRQWRTLSSEERAEQSETSDTGQRIPARKARSSKTTVTWEQWPSSSPKLSLRALASSTACTPTRAHSREHNEQHQPNTIDEKRVRE